MIKFLDIKKINDEYASEIKEAVDRVIDSGWYILGNEVSKFEIEFAKFHDIEHVIGTSNGLDALKLIIRAYIELGVFKEGDEILVPANTFIASVLAISESKLVPVLVEVSEDDFLINPSEIEKHITSKTKGIMNVHLYGQISYGKDLQHIIEKHNLIHIEDNAQAIGAIKDGQMAGTIGDAGAVSFYPGKNLGALGDAGAILTKDGTLANMCRALGNYGSEEKYVHKLKGYNNRMDEMQAAVLRVKLKDIKQANTKRQEIAQRYVAGITNNKIVLPQITEDANNSVWHLFVIRCQERDQLQSYLTSKGIQSLIHYPIPIHKQESYQNIVRDSFEITERLSNEILSIPISPVLTDMEIEEIIDSLNSF